jgi:hypothetical protein
MPVGSTDWVSAISQIGVDADGPAETPESEGPGETAPAAIIPEPQGAEPPPAEPEAQSGNAADGGALTQSIVGLAPEPEGEGVAVAPQLIGLIPEQEGGSGMESAAPPILSLIPEAEGLGGAADAPAIEPASAIVGLGIDVGNSPAGAVVETNQDANSPAPALLAVAAVDQVMADAENGAGQDSDMAQFASESAGGSTDSTELEPIDLAFETLDLWLLDA